jgi:hypothetical protein
VSGFEGERATSNLQHITQRSRNQTREGSAGLLDRASRDLPKVGQARENVRGARTFQGTGLPRSAAATESQGIEELRD